MTPVSRLHAVWLPTYWPDGVERLGFRALFCLTFGSAASILFSIAISQILLVAGLLLVVILRPKLDLPPIRLPLALFCAATIVADLVSGHPLAGAPQIRKLFVFGIILLVSSAFRHSKEIRWLVATWVGIGVLSAVDGLVHVVLRWREAIQLKWNVYDYLVYDRITGFSSHWMTFGGEQMIVLLMLIAFLLCNRRREWVGVGWCCAVVLWASLIFGLTRSVFLLGVPIGVVCLIAMTKPRALLAVPLVALISYFAMPAYVQARVQSAVWPHDASDSNAQRYIMRRAGWQMVKAHPWFGLGPEQIKPQFESFVPPDIPKPLPRGWYGHLHNIYLQYAAERGVPALLFLLWMIGKMLWDFTTAIRIRSLPDEDRYVVHGAIAVILAVLAEGMFEYNLGDTEVLTMFLIVGTSAYNVIQQHSRSSNCAAS